MDNWAFEGSVTARLARRLATDALAMTVEVIPHEQGPVRNGATSPCGCWTPQAFRASSSVNMPEEGLSLGRTRPLVL